MPVVINGASGVILPPGSIDAPIIRSNDADTGFSFPAAGQLGVIVDGVNQATFSSSGVIFNSNVVLGGSSTFPSGFTSSGVGSFGAGSATTPSVAIGTGTTNKPGIYSPGANQLALATNGTGRLFVDASGQVGVGTSAPGSRLTVAQGGGQLFELNNLTSAADNRRWVFAGSATSIDLACRTDAGAGGGNFFRFNRSNEQVQSLQGFKDGAAWFHVDNSTGRVGIGITSPFAPLDVVTGAASRLLFRDLGVGARIDSVNLGNSAFEDLVVNGAPLIFQTDGNERARIDSSGRLGLGTSSPGAIIHTYANVTGGNPSTSGTTDANVFARFQGGSINFDLGVTSPGHVWLQPRLISNFATNTNLLLCPNGGNVGIGTTSPSALLHVSAVNANIRIGVDASSQYTDIFRDNSTGFTVYNAAQAGAFRGHVWQLGGTEAARIDSSGRLLVGTSSESGNSKAVVVGNTGSPTGTGAFSVKLGTTRPTTTDQEIGVIRFESTSNTASNYHYASIFAYTDGASSSDTDIPGRLVFSTTADGSASPTERLRIANDGALTCKVNTATRMLIDATNGGSTHFSCTGLAGTDNAPNAEGGIIHQSNGNTKVRGASTNNTLFQWYYFNNTTSPVGTITVGTSSTSYATSSDYRLKENIVPLTGAIDRLNDLQIHRFNFIVDPGHTVDGFLAHEAQAVVPECVTGTKDEVDAEGNPIYQGIDQSKLVPLLTAALQEAIAKIESLEARLTAAGI